MNEKIKSYREFALARARAMREATKSGGLERAFYDMLANELSGRMSELLYAMSETECKKCLMFTCGLMDAGRENAS